MILLLDTRALLWFLSRLSGQVSSSLMHGTTLAVSSTAWPLKDTHRLGEGRNAVTAADDALPVRAPSAGDEA
jgi:hypothetical protein